MIQVIIIITYIDIKPFNLDFNNDAKLNREQFHRRMIGISPVLDEPNHNT